MLLEPPILSLSPPPPNHWSSPPGEMSPPPSDISLPPPSDLSPIPLSAVHGDGGEVPWPWAKSLVTVSLRFTINNAWVCFSGHLATDELCNPFEISLINTCYDTWIIDRIYWTELSPGTE